MKKKSIAVALTAACVTLSATLGGCSLVTKNNTADLAQEIATVDIRKSEKFDASGLSAYADAITSSSVLKRDLLTAFLNVGASYMNSNSSATYADVFNLLVESLVNNEILTQYAIMALLQDKATNTNSILGYDANALNTFTSLNGDKEKFEYLLGGENCEKNNQVKLAKYRWYSSLNSAIDNYETTAEDEEGYVGTETRTTPANIDTEQDDYFPKDENGNLNYNIYTGYTGYLLSDSGAYKDDAQEGTTADSRKKAYNRFLNYLRRNDFMTAEDEKNITDIKSIGYIQQQYVSQLESCIVNVYYDIYEEQQAQELSKNNYEYINDIYNELKDGQEDVYTTASAFESAMGSMSSTSFVLYSPETSDSDKLVDVDEGSTEYQPRYGFVYNILLPFDSKQSVKLAELNSIKTLDEDEDYYYTERNKLLRDIKTEDQRGAWFNGQTDYSFKASESSITEYYGKSANRGYLFFENNLTQSEDGERYKKLQAYEGLYSYNGSVYENEDGSYTLLGNKLTIDGMLQEFSAYINYVCGSTVTFDNGYTLGEENSAYYNRTKFHKENDEDEIDYSKFLYASGKVDFGTFNNSDLFYADSVQYKAMSAVNELQFAYTTDTSVLSQYVGYSVSAYDTNYIKEFEYAAKLAVSKGAGNFAVCAGDYGWHLVYVTYAFGGDGGEVYSPNWAENVDKEGTFENLFFEWIKGNSISDITTNLRDKLISDYNRDSGDNAPVVKYQSRYQNLLDLKNE